jgi:hypothetical protein
MTCSHSIPFTETCTVCDDLLLDWQVRSVQAMSRGTERPPLAPDLAKRRALLVEKVFCKSDVPKWTNTKVTFSDGQ